MKKIITLLFGAAALPAYLLAGEVADSILSAWEKELELNEVVVAGRRPVLKQSTDGIVYLTKNDPYALGLNGIQLLDRIPRVSVSNDQINVAGKSSVKYIIDGHLLEMTDEALSLRMKNLQSSDIEKIELLTTPPAKYAAAGNVAYIRITTRDVSRGTRGNIWGNGIFRDDFSHILGGNISHTARKIELSIDAAWQDTKGINDLDRTYYFYDNEITSFRTNRFTNRSLSANGLLKYKLCDKLSVGTIVNFNMMRLKSNLVDETVDTDASAWSQNISPARPNNAVTLTVFGDWNIDGTGKLISLTYNYFNRHIHSFSDVTTRQNDENITRLTNNGTNKYGIHSIKLDATLPFSTVRIDAGVAYTNIDNGTDLHINDFIDGAWIDNLLQSNSFDYYERTAAIYAGIEKTFPGNFFCRLGLRYEHTDTKGLQLIDNTHNYRSYGYLFPSLIMSLNTPDAGRLAISYSMGMTRPNFNDLNPFRYYTTVSDYFSGNPDLGPSISHNAEINYSFKGIYAVLYNSYSHNAIGNITRFSHDGDRYTIPENCLNTNKTGLYTSFNRSLS